MTSEQNENTANNMAVSVTAQYVRDFSFESPNAPHIFSFLQLAPEISMGVNIHTRVFAANSHEVLLAIKLEAKLEDKTAFIAEILYGGIFGVPSLPEEHLKFFLMVEAPRLLFPFARSILMDAIRDGGFPNVIINPIDFLALYVTNQSNKSMPPAVGAA